MVQLFIDRNIMISKCRQFKGMIKKKKKKGQVGKS